MTTQSDLIPEVVEVAAEMGVSNATALELAHASPALRVLSQTLLALPNTVPGSPERVEASTPAIEAFASLELQYKTATRMIGMKP